MPQAGESVNGPMGGISYLLVPSIFWVFSLGLKWYPWVERQNVSFRYLKHWQ
jgi:hypothetical protein